MATIAWLLDRPLTYTADYLRTIAAQPWPPDRHQQLKPLQDVFTEQEQILGDYVNCRYATKWRYIMNYLYRLLHLETCELFDELHAAVNKITLRLDKMKPTLANVFGSKWVGARIPGYKQIIQHWEKARSRPELIEKVIRVYLIFNEVLYRTVLTQVLGER